MPPSGFRGYIGRIRHFGLQNSLFFCQYRQISGLLFVPGEPLTAYPNDATCLAVKSLMWQENRRFLLYQALKRPVNTPSTSVALSVISEYEVLRERNTEIISALPLIHRNFSDLEAAEAADTAGIDLEDDNHELPRHLQPVAMDDGIPMRPEGARSDFVDPDSIEDYDALDYRNTWLRDIFKGEETEYYSNEAVNAWIRADMEECSKGARPRFYKVYEEVRNESVMALAEYYDASPLTDSSSLSPVLLIYQIPDQSPQISAHSAEKVAPKTEQQFLQMFRRYAYLTSNESYHRISAFTQDDPMFPRWLIVQEFTSNIEFNDTVAAKKKEAEWWWRDNGWNGVLLEFFWRENQRESKTRRMKHDQT